MQKIAAVILALITLSFASCATQQPTTTTSNQSPMSRDNGNGLASAMH